MLQDGSDVASRISPRSSKPGGPWFHELLLRTGWDDGPCAYLWVRRPKPPGMRMGGLSEPLIVMLTAVVLVMVAIFWALLGPAIRRVRRLAEQVRTSARNGYREPIEVKGSDEIADLAEAFAEAGREVRNQISKQEAREQTLRNFLANTTHDVMIPLTVLQGHLSSMRKGLSEGGQVSNKTLDSAVEECHYMASLIHNLSIAAKLEAGEPHFQRTAVDLNHVVERCYARHRPIADNCGIEIDRAVPESSTTVSGDVTLIEQAVSNVVYNAIRYNRMGGHVAVIVELVGTQQFMLRVIDDGPGILASNRARLMERSVRGTNGRGRSGVGQGLGQGLGLSITREVCALHEWSLQLTDSEAGGLEVILTGPIQQPIEEDGRPR